jgi:hypothetical protein
MNVAKNIAAYKGKIIPFYFALLERSFRLAKHVANKIIRVLLVVTAMFGHYLLAK